MNMEILEVLHKRHSISVLQCLDVPKTIPQVQDETEVPPASVYRRVDELEDKGLVEQTGSELRNRQKTPEYRRTISDIRIDLSQDEIVLNKLSRDDVDARRNLQKYRRNSD